MKLFYKIFRKLNSIFSINIAIPPILIFALLAFIFATIEMFYPALTKIISFEEQKISHYGNFLAGLFSFISVVLIAFTLKHQADTTKLSRFEDHFFQLLKVQRDNSSAISNNKNLGGAGFKSLLEEFKVTLEVTRNYENEGKELDEHRIVNLAYLAFFYGIKSDDDDDQILIKCIKDDEKYKSFDVKSYIKKLNDYKSNKLKYPSNSRNLFKGHQVKLGHYYRHLFETVKFVNDQSPYFLSYKQKCKYVKLLRAQISTQEQMLFFFDSISQLGAVWELGVSANKVNKHLITKYNLLTNIADPEIYDIDIREYYPKLKLARKQEFEAPIFKPREKIDEKNHEQEVQKKREELKKYYT